jgi:hypothetical protein
MGPAVCTTFPNEAWDVYARACLQSFARFWPADAELFVYLDDAQLSAACEEALAGRTAQVRVGKLAAHDRFLSRNLPREPRGFRYAACRFSHKIAAIKATLDRLSTDPVQSLIWLDADVITTARVTSQWLSQFLPTGNAHVSYLGRKSMPYSECGFMGFRLSDEARAFVDAFWALYETEVLFKHAEWHDSFLFDRVREGFDSAWFSNISAGVGGMHVWLGTPLAERLEHWKGPEAKRLHRPVTDAEVVAIARRNRGETGA